MSDSLSSDLASLKIDRGEGPPGPPWGRWIGALVVIAALVGAGVWGWPHLEARLFQTEVRTTVILSVSPAQASQTLTSTGYVVPRVRSKVGSRIAGRVVTVHVSEGQRVSAGDLLVELDAIDQETSLAAARTRVLTARANVATARAQVAEVQQQIARQRTLVQRGVAARSTLEDLEARAGSLEAAVAAAQATVRAAQAEVEVLRVGVDQTEIVAPISGTVIDEPVRVGETVDPAGAPLMEIADLESLVVETDVPEGRLSLVQPGAPCEVVLDAFPGERFRGSTVEIGQQVDRAKATVVTRVRFVDQPPRVLPDMSARVSFLSEELDEAALRAPDRVVVPEAALTDRAGRRVVFVVDDGTVREVEVRVGEPAPGGFDLVSGPRPGTRVVADPPETLQDGQRIREAD